MENKILLNKKSFLESLSIGGYYAGKNKTIPILECIRCKVADGMMRITSYDSETASSAKCAVESSDLPKCSFCIPYRDAINYIQKIDSDVFTLVTNDETARCDIRHDNGSMMIPMFPADDFPSIENIKDAKTLEIPSSLIAHWISIGIRFISNQDYRPVLMNMYFERKDNMFTFCCTDSHVLITSNYPCNDECEDISMMIPNNCMGFFLKILKSSGTDDVVSVKVGESQIVFTFGDGTSLMSRTIDGRYPNFRSVIPQNRDKKVNFDRNSMLSSLSRLSSAGCNARLEFKGDEVVVTAESLDSGISGHETIPCEYLSDMVIGIGLENLQKCLSAMDDEFDLYIENSNRPVIFKNKNNDMLTLVMPIKLN